MGVSMSWLAVRDLEPDAVHKHLGLLSSREFDAGRGQPFLGRLLPDGWYLVVANRCDHPMVLDERLSSMSMNARVVAASIEEHVMFCFSTCWLNGKQEWRVQHEAEKGITHLQISGAPPVELDTIRQSALTRQMCLEDGAGVDYVFDVPLDLAKRVVGFKHGQSTAGPELELFEILKAEQRAKRPRKKTPRKKTRRRL